jgi:hypothetical protein
MQLPPAQRLIHRGSTGVVRRFPRVPRWGVEVHRGELRWSFSSRYLTITDVSASQRPPYLKRAIGSKTGSDILRRMANDGASQAASGGNAYHEPRYTRGPRQGGRGIQASGRGDLTFARGKLPHSVIHFASEESLQDPPLQPLDAQVRAAPRRRFAWPSRRWNRG